VLVCVNVTPGVGRLDVRLVLVALFVRGWSVVSGVVVVGSVRRSVHAVGVRVVRVRRIISH
jgi:hypothetical protein